MAEKYSKASDVSVKIENMEVPVQFNGKQTVATIAEAEITLAQLKSQLVEAQSRLDTLDKQHTEAFDRLTGELKAIQTRYDEAIKLGIVETAQTVG